MPLITQHHGVGFKGSKTMLGDLKFQSGKEIQEELETHRQSHRKAARLELLLVCLPLDSGFPQVSGVWGKVSVWGMERGHGHGNTTCWG